MTEDMTTADDTITMTMRLDEDDFDTLIDEIGFRCGRSLPVGTSDRLGAIVGEICRDLGEYRSKAEKCIGKADVRRALLAFRAKLPADTYGGHAAVNALLRELGLEG